MAGNGTAHMRTDAEDVLLSVEHLVVELPAGRRRVVHAVSDVSLDLREGETLGLVGESGCGKSTTARAVVALVPPTSGAVRYRGHDLGALGGEALRALRPEIQMLFQDPRSSLNPRRRVHDIVAEGASIWGRGDDRRVDEVLRAVGLDPEAARHRRPHQYSGGQCQRIALARALLLEPRLLVCDEPVSSLDVSVQAQVLELLADMRARHDLSLLFISHDLAVVRHVSDRVAVMYLGTLCEVGAVDTVFSHPTHPYTRMLLDAVPDAGDEPPPDGGDGPPTTAVEPPSPLDPPSGCRFRTRCPRADATCAAVVPTMAAAGPGDHWVACHHPLP